MKDKLRKLAEDYTVSTEAGQALYNELCVLFSVINSALIDYIENEAEIAMPINELMHEDGRHLTKKEYGKVLLKYLVKKLREHYC